MTARDLHTSFMQLYMLTEHIEKTKHNTTCPTTNKKSTSTETKVIYTKKKKSLFTVKVYLYIKTAKIKLKKMFQMLQCLSKKHLTHQTAVLRTRI